MTPLDALRWQVKQDILHLSEPRSAHHGYVERWRCIETTSEGTHEGTPEGTLRGRASPILLPSAGATR
jgi:hypothetical protein